MYSSLNHCVQCAWRLYPHLGLMHTEQHTRYTYIIHYTFSITDISYGFFILSRIFCAHLNSMFFLTSWCIISAIASWNDRYFFFLSTILLFLSSFFQSFISISKAEMRFIKRFVQSVQGFLPLYFLSSFFWKIKMQKETEKCEKSEKNKWKNHNTMATIVICIIRTRVLRNERLFSGSSDSLNRARPFPFEIRHRHTDTHTLMQCTFRLIVSFQLSLPLPSSSSQFLILVFFGFVFCFTRNVVTPKTMLFNMLWYARTIHFSSMSTLFNAKKHEQKPSN